MATASPDPYYTVKTALPRDVADRFRAVARSRDRTVTQELRRLVRREVEAAQAPGSAGDRP